jgi:hypothetical protein
MKKLLATAAVAAFALAATIAAIAPSNAESLPEKMLGSWCEKTTESSTADADQIQLYERNDDEYFERNGGFGCRRPERLFLSRKKLIREEIVCKILRTKRRGTTYLLTLNCEDTFETKLKGTSETTIEHEKLTLSPDGLKREW